MGKKKEKFWMPETSFIGGSSWDDGGKKKKKKDKSDKGDGKKNKEKGKKNKKKNKDSFVSHKNGNGNFKKDKEKGMEYKTLLSKDTAPGLYQIVSNIFDDGLEIYIVKPETGFPIELTTGDNYKMFVSGTLPADCEYSVNKVMYSSRVIPVNVDRTLERILVDYVSCYNACSSPTEEDDSE